MFTRLLRAHEAFQRWQKSSPISSWLVLGALAVLSYEIVSWQFNGTQTHTQTYRVMHLELLRRILQQ